MSQILKNTKIGELVAAKKLLIDAPFNQGAEATYKILKENNILAIPVYKLHHDKKEYIGILSVFNLMTYIAFGAYFKNQKSDLENLKNFHWGNTAIGELLKVDEESTTMWSYPSETSLSVIMEAFSKGVHRALVTFSNGDVKILTQTDVIKFIALHKKEFSNDILNKRLEELNLVNPLSKGENIVSIADTDSALEGYRLLYVNKVTALPIVNNSKEIIATLSASDLRGINEHNLFNVTLKATEFLKGLSNDGKLQHSVTVTPRETLNDSIIKCVAAKIHRVWIINSAQTPIGVISFTDIINTIWVSCGQ